MAKLEKIHVIWLSGEGCDGCSIAVLGATNPPVEALLAGLVPGLPQIILFHTVLAVESGQGYIENLKKAEAGALAPFALVVEGSIPNEGLAKDGYWIALGEEDGRPIKMTEWLRRLAPKAAAVIAIGTCATWGGIPAAEHNPTDAMGLMDFLGRDFKSALGLPIINVPGCAPQGDNFVETVAALLLYLQGIGPAPQLDELGRPAWLYDTTSREHCPRAGFAEAGRYAKEYGDRECLMNLGCWGPVVKCNVPLRGWINGIGGVTNVGGKCIGCTMPGFPDKFSPFFKRSPGSRISSPLTKIVGGSLRGLRQRTIRDVDKSRRWK